jgi:transposase
MKKYECFIGVDVSKSKLDVCMLDITDTTKSCHFEVKNDKKEISRFLKAMMQKQKVNSSSVIFCLEHTGVYAMPVCCVLAQLNLDYVLVPAAHIQKSVGMQRGKNDKADAKVIARFVHLHHQELTLHQLPEEKLAKMKTLLSHRERLMKARKMFQVARGEMEGYMDKSLCKEVCQDSNALVKNLNKRISKVDKQILNIILADEKLKQTFELIISVPGVGSQVAFNLIVCTQCFTAFETYRQLSCYAGIAPFEYSSGSSIKGRTRVSHLANKKMKSLLSMAALSAVQSDVELRRYYERKTGEGKNPMLVLNAVRNKIISRVFATVSRGTPFVETHRFATI